LFVEKITIFTGRKGGEKSGRISVGNVSSKIKSYFLEERKR